MEHVLCSRSQNSPNSTHRLSQTSCVRLWGFYTKSGSGGSTIFDSRSEAGGFPTVKSFSLVVYSNGHDCPWVYWLRSSSDKNKHSDGKRRSVRSFCAGSGRITPKTLDVRSVGVRPQKAKSAVFLRENASRNAMYFTCVLTTDTQSIYNFLSSHADGPYVKSFWSYTSGPGAK